jgi:hypothetical protein
MGVAVLLASGAALGITNGNPDNGEHPNVGALVEIPRRGAPYPYCSGTLISPTVFLTAAHCGDNGEAVNVTFVETDFSRTNLSGQTYSGTFRADNIIDIAVVVFEKPPFPDPNDPNNAHKSAVTPAQLPSLKRLERSDVGKGETYGKFTAVGYGGQEPVKQPGGPVIVYNDEREWAVSTFKSLNRTYLSLSQNLHQGNGGTCYGDSGGPNFFGEYPYDYDNNPKTENVPVIAGITSTGDTWCKATNVTVRLDTQAAHDFLSRPFLDGHDVTLPSEVTPP